MNLRTSDYKKRILSGMRPTGPLHIGHLFGALSNWRRLQDSGYDCFYMIADWHALSTEYQSPGAIRNNVEEIALDFLSCGLDPEKSVIFVQSLVPEHIELHMVFSMIVPVPWLERNPVYKEQQEEMREKELNTYGFLGYPVLQAADILVYKAHHVPIGIDQVPHLELTREIARRFNFLYGEYFPEPAALLTETPKIPGTDGRKMSKSYGNAIFLKDSPDDVRKKVSVMFTDPKRIYKKDPGHPDECPVFAYHKLTGGEHERIRRDCLCAKVGCVECKRIMAEALVGILAPIQEKRRALAENPEQLKSILRDGTEHAATAAKQIMNDVRKLVGIRYER